MIRVLFYFFFLFCLLCRQSDLFAYASSVKVFLKNSLGENINTISARHTHINFLVQATYCLDTDHSSGKYKFILWIKNPRGQTSYSAYSTSNSIPSKGQILQHNFKVSLKELSSSLGEYTVKAMYEEVHSSEKFTEVTEKKFNYVKSIFDLSERAREVNLISPIGESKILDRYPYFRWNSPEDSLDLHYTIWISENKDPLINTVFKESRILTNDLTYPSNAQVLHPGRIYYWQIRAFDGGNQPVGGKDGFSRVESFIISVNVLPKLELIYPIQKEVSKKQVLFSWKQFYQADHYLLEIAMDNNFEKTVWSGISKVPYLKVPVKKIFLTHNVSRFFWRIQAYNKSDFPLKASEITFFTFVNESKVASDQKPLPGRSILNGTVRDIFNEPIPEAFIVVAKNIKNLIELEKLNERNAIPNIQSNVSIKKNMHEKIFTKPSKENGDYSFDLPPGNFQLAVYKDKYLLYVEKFSSILGKILSIDVGLVPVFSSVWGNIQDVDTGSAIQNVTVGFRNRYNYQSVKTDENGFYKIPKLINGNYILEISKYPDYKEIIETNFSVEGHKIKKDYQMERIKSGILSGDIFESVKKSPVSDAYIYIKPIRVSSLISSGQVNGDAYSSKEGKFSIHDLRVGLYKVYCKAPGFPEIYKNIKIRSGQLTHISINLDAIQWKITGRVVDQEKKPVKGARIIVAEYPGMPKSYTDIDGRFEMDVPNGKYDIEFYLPGKSIETREIMVQDNDLKLEEIILYNTFGYWNVQLLFPNGEVVNDFSITAIPDLKGHDQDEEVQKHHSSKGEIKLRLPGNINYQIQFYLPENLRSKYSVPAVRSFLNESSIENMAIYLEKKLVLNGVVLNSQKEGIQDVLIHDMNTGNTFKSVKNGFFTYTTTEAEDEALYSFKFSHPEYYTHIEHTKLSSDELNSFPSKVELKVILVDQHDKLSSDIKEEIEKEINAVYAELKKIKDTEDSELKQILEKQKQIERIYENIRSKKKDLFDLKKNFEKKAKGIIYELKEGAKKSLSVKDDILDILNEGYLLFEKWNIFLKDMDADIIHVAHQLKSKLNSLLYSNHIQLDSIKEKIFKIKRNLEGKIDILEYHREFLEDKIEDTKVEMEYLKDHFSQAYNKKISVFENILESGNDLYEDIQQRKKEVGDILVRLENSASGIASSQDILSLNFIDFKKRLRKILEIDANIQKEINQLDIWFSGVTKIVQERISRALSKYHKILNFEKEVRETLEKIKNFQTQMHSMEKYLEINRIDQFSASIRARLIRGDEPRIIFSGILEAYNPILGKQELQIGDIDLKLEAFLSNELKKFLSNGSKLIEILPTQWNIFLDEKKGFSLSDHFRKDIQKQLEPFLSSEIKEKSSLSMTNKFIQEKIPSLLEIMPQIKKLRDTPFIIKKAFQANSSSTSVLNITLEKLTKKQKSLLRRKDGAASLLGEYISKEYFNALQVKSSQVLKQPDKFLNEWKESIFKGAYGSFLERYKIDSKLTPSQVGQYGWFDSTLFKINSEKEYFLKSIAERLPNTFDLKEIRSPLIEELLNFSRNEFIKSIKEKFIQKIAELDIPIMSKWAFNFYGIKGEFFNIRLGFDQKEKSVFLEGQAQLDLKDSIMELSGLKTINSERSIRFYSNGRSNWGRISFLFDANNAQIGSYHLKLKKIMIDFNQKLIFLSGSIQLPFIEKEIKFRQAIISYKSHWHLVKMDLQADPPILIQYGNWKFVFRGAQYSSRGISFTGDMSLGSPFNKNLKIKSVLVDRSGRIRQTSISGFRSNFFLGSIQIGKASFQDKDGRMRLILQNVLLDIPKIHLSGLNIRQMSIENDGKKGRLSIQIGGADIPIHREFSFSGFKVSIHSVSFDMENDQYFFLVQGGVDFKFPFLSVQVGNFKIHENGKLNVSRFHIGVNLSAISISGGIEYKKQRFLGKGHIQVVDVFSLETAFEFGHGYWRVFFDIGSAPIPIPGTPLFLSHIKGGLENNRKNIIISFGCTIGIAEILGGSVMMNIDAGNGDILVTGAAELIRPQRIKLAEFRGFISTRNGIFEGESRMDHSISGFKARGEVNFHFSTKKWGVGALVDVNAFKIIRGYGGIYIGYRYPSEFQFKGKTVVPPTNVNGVMFFVGSHFPLSFVLLRMQFEAEVFIHLGNPLVAGLYASVEAKMDLIILSVSLGLMIDLGGQIGNHSTYFSGSITGKGCIKILRIQKCAQKTVQYTIGNRPDHRVVSNEITSNPIYPKELSVLGTVSDNKGSIISGAKVTLYKENGQIYRKTISQADGDFNLGKVEANGNQYTIKATKSSEPEKNLFYKTITHKFVLRTKNYKAFLEMPLFYRNKKIIVYAINAANQKPLKEAMITFENKSSKSDVHSILTDKNGKAIFEKADEGRTYIINAQKKNYTPKKVEHKVIHYQNQKIMKLNFAGVYLFKIPVYLDKTDVENSGISIKEYITFLNALCNSISIKAISKENILHKGNVRCEERILSKFYANAPVMYFIFDQIHETGSYDIAIENINFAQPKKMLPVAVTEEFVSLRGKLDPRCRNKISLCYYLPKIKLSGFDLRVMDHHTDQPIAGANILFNGNYTLKADLSGYARKLGIEDHSYDVQVTPPDKIKRIYERTQKFSFQTRMGQYKELRLKRNTYGLSDAVMKQGHLGETFDRISDKEAEKEFITNQDETQPSIPVQNESKEPSPKVTEEVERDFPIEIEPTFILPSFLSRQKKNVIIQNMQSSLQLNIKDNALNMIYKGSYQNAIIHVSEELGQYIKNSERYFLFEYYFQRDQSNANPQLIFSEKIKFKDMVSKTGFKKLRPTITTNIFPHEKEFAIKIFRMNYTKDKLIVEEKTHITSLLKKITPLTNDWICNLSGTYFPILKITRLKGSIRIRYLSINNDEEELRCDHTGDTLFISNEKINMLGCKGDHCYFVMEKFTPYSFRFSATYRNMIGWNDSIEFEDMGKNIAISLMLGNKKISKQTSIQFTESYQKDQEGPFKAIAYPVVNIAILSFDTLNKWYRGSNIPDRLLQLYTDQYEIQKDKKAYLKAEAPDIWRLYMSEKEEKAIPDNLKKTFLD